MTKRVRDKYKGYTIEEDLARRPSGLAIDAIGLWQIVAAGRDNFELTGTDLLNYVRRHILNLLENGAKPVKAAMDGVHFWKIVDYGNNPEKIAGAIISEWLESGGEIDPGGVWFALPHIYEATKSQNRD
jgi:hypothetical protein